MRSSGAKRGSANEMPGSVAGHDDGSIFEGVVLLALNRQLYSRNG